jgi:hypothetical protein
MITVFRYGNTIDVVNPINPHQKTRMVNVTFVEEGRRGANQFVEEGRRGANHQVSDTSAILDQLIADELGAGETTGINTLRIHTQPVREDKLHLFPIGKTLNGFINRQLFSTPQLRQQEGRPPRMIDGRPTFFTTTIADRAVDDQDLRLSNERLSEIHPEYFSERVNSQTARVDVVRTASPEEQQQDMDVVMSTTWASDHQQGQPPVGAANPNDFTDVDLS